MTFSPSFFYKHKQQGIRKQNIKKLRKVFFLGHNISFLKSEFFSLPIFPVADFFNADGKYIFILSSYNPNFPATFRWASRELFLKILAPERCKFQLGCSSGAQSISCAESISSFFAAKKSTQIKKNHFVFLYYHLKGYVNKQIILKK